MIDHYNYRYRLTDEDNKVYDRLLPLNHILQDFLNLIDWDKIGQSLECYYSAEKGKPGIPPIYLVKMEFLRYFYRLSDSQVYGRCCTDVAFRWFMQLPIDKDPPDQTTLCKFRGRIGKDGYQVIFDQIIHQARDAGLVKDRLRVKDASHVHASIAIPTSLQLFAQLRDRLLREIAVIDRLVSDGFRAASDQARQETEKGSEATRLDRRVDLIRDILAWIEKSKPSQDSSDVSSAWQQLLRTYNLAQKILNDQTDPDATDKILSLVDTDARRGKHGEWFDGYKVDMLVDGDSQLITQVNVITASGNEAANCITLVMGEMRTFGNQIETVSMDRAGYDGAMIRELEDPQKANVEVIVPPKNRPETGLFTSDEFKVSEDGSQVTCPAGKTSSRRNLQLDGRRVQYTFSKETCAGCPLLKQCMKQLPKGRMGRCVSKNEYETEYARVASRSRSEHYAKIRAEHPLVERKFTEPLNRHGGRHTPYRGLEKTTMHELMAATATNVKRMVKLLLGSVCAQPA